MPWHVIQYVSSGFTLAAFVVAVIAWVLKSKSEAKGKLIGLAKEDERASLVRDALEFFHVETAGLSKAQQYQLALEQVRARAQRFKTVAVVVCILALLGTVVAIYAITRPKSPTDKPKLLAAALSIWRVESDRKGELVATRKFSDALGTALTDSLEGMAEWVSQSLALPKDENVPRVRLKIRIPADLKTEDPVIERTPDGPMEVLLWNTLDAGKARLKMTSKLIKEMEKPFHLEIRVPGSEVQVVEVTPGKALTRDSEIPPAKVRVGVESFTGRNAGVVERLCAQLSAVRLVAVVDPAMLETAREEVKRHNEEIRRNPYAQHSLRSLGVDYIISGNVEP